MCQPQEFMFLSQISKDNSKKPPHSAAKKILGLFTILVFSTNIFPHESLTLITNRFTKHRKTSYMHVYQTGTAHCGNMPWGFKHLSWPYQGTLATGKRDSMKTASFSFSVPKLPTLFCASIAEPARKTPLMFQSWSNDFKPAEILQMTFAKAVLKFPYFQAPCKNCKFNYSGRFGKQYIFPGMGKEWQKLFSALKKHLRDQSKSCLLL